MTNSDKIRLGSEIREVRKARGLTLNNLSSMLSCSTAYLSRIERGTAQVSEILIVEISTALNIEKNWFFPDKLGVGPLEI
ncbi:MAG: helix-turn-helix transcriptional regulator, partial [Rhodobacterales bacterium]|nr:helix-turn-helix transcriptional regulator [Rhodobacterales bacterium]